MIYISYSMPVIEHMMIDLWHIKRPCFAQPSSLKHSFCPLLHFHSSLFMADSDSNPPSCAPSPSPQTPDSDTTFCVSSQITYHISVLAPKGSKAKPKVKKEIKTKEFTHQFCATSECYLLLLKTILLKHSQDKYKVTAQKRYSIKILCSPSHVYAQVYVNAEPKVY